MNSSSFLTSRTSLLQIAQRPRRRDSTREVPGTQKFFREVLEDRL